MPSCGGGVEAAGRSGNTKAARRMLGIALVLEGIDRTTAAKTCGMDRQTLWDWVHRYNAEGLAGFVNRSRGAAPRRLDAGQLAEVASWVEGGPGPGGGRGGALAAAGPAQPDRGAVRGHGARADAGQVPGGDRRPASSGPSPTRPPWNRCFRSANRGPKTPRKAVSHLASMSHAARRLSADQLILKRIPKHRHVTLDGGSGSPRYTITV